MAQSPAYGGDKRPSGYGRRWPKWLAIYVVAAAIIYAIVYFAFLHHSGGYGGGGTGGGGSGGGGEGYWVIPLPLMYLRSLLTRRSR